MEQELIKRTKDAIDENDRERFEDINEIANVFLRKVFSKMEHYKDQFIRNIDAKKSKKYIKRLIEIVKTTIMISETKGVSI